MLTFEQAEKLYAERPVKKKRSVLLASGVYLLQLTEDRYAVQVFNTYAVRICRNGCYILNMGRNKSLQIAEVISKYSPTRLALTNSVWMDQHRQPFQNSCVVDSNGLPV